VTDPAVQGGIALIEVAGLARPDFWRYCLRFDREGRPALYQDGHRLTCPWKILIDLAQPADEQGASANTRSA
jgi:hypothetical protein